MLRLLHDGLECIVQLVVDDNLIRVVLLRAFLVEFENQLQNRVDLIQHLLRMAQVEAHAVLEDERYVLELN